MGLLYLKPGIALPVATCVVMLSVGARAPRVEARQDALPQARSIIDKHLKAIGGREALLAQTSTHSIGTVTLPGPGITGKVETFHSKPNKFLQRMSIPGVGDFEEGFDGTVAWSLSPMMGPMILEGKQLEQRRFDMDFFEELKAPDRYSSITTVEKTTFEGRPAYTIKLVKKNGEEDIEYYDAETGFRVGAKATRESPMGAIQATTAWTDYKQFGPLMQPVTMKVSMMSVQMVMTIQSYEFGRVDPSVFAVPAQIKAIVK
jgi:hypothetical protein